MNLLEVNTICGLCLRVDEKVNKLKSTHHKAFIESIVKLKKYNYVPTEDPYVCYICKTFVTKTYRFVQTIWKAQDIICDMLKNTEMVTMPMLEHIRHDNGLNPIALSSVVICDNEIIFGVHEESDLCTKTEIDFEEEESVQYQENKEVIYVDQTENNGNTKSSYLDDEQLEMQNPLEDDTIIVSSDTEENTHLKQKLKMLGKQKKKINNNKKRIYIYVTKPNMEACDVPKPKKRKVPEERRPSIETEDPIFSDNNIQSINEKNTVNEQDSNMNDTQNNTIIKPSSMEASDFLETKKRKVCLQKNLVFKERSPSIETEDSSSSENESQNSKKKKEDEDYQPDSTSHSDDSDFDAYDDTGKRIAKPRCGRAYPRQCDHCSYEIPKLVDHYYHYQFMHPDTEYPYSREKPYTCTICGKRFTKWQINAHELGHTNLNIKCSLCPKVYPSQLKLYQHTQRCHPKRTFTCDYCSKVFKTRTDIVRHIRIHTGSKPYKCHICGEGFAHSGNRLIHIRSKHQNLKYVPKKRLQKVRKNNKFEESSDEETIRRTKKKAKKKTPRKVNNEPETETTEVALKKKNKITKRKSKKNSKVDNEDTAMTSGVEKAKQRHKRKKKAEIIDNHNGTNDNCDTGKNGNNAETESDEEMLIVLKKKIDGNS